MIAALERHALAKAVKHQTPEERSRMLRAMKMSDHLLDRWLKSPDGDALSEEALEQVLGWTRGEYGCISSGDGSLHLIKLAKAPSVMLGVKPPVAKGNPTDFGDPANGKLHQQTGPQPAKGLSQGSHKDFETPELLKHKAAVKAEEAAKPQKKPMLGLGWGRADPITRG